MNKHVQEFILINGYGVPMDIFKDDHYRHYLNTIFNTIYEASVRHNLEPVIIFSGGKTDMFKPYRRTEANEMAKYFKALARRPCVIKTTKSWKYELESKSLSSLENILFARELLKKKYPKIKSGRLVFESTRSRRIRTVAKRIFAHFSDLNFMPIEFDVSINRYDLDLVDAKEAYGLKLDLWGLKNANNLKLHHDLFTAKIRDLRQAGPEHHQEAIHKWWQKSLQIITKA